MNNYFNNIKHLFKEIDNYFSEDITKGNKSFYFHCFGHNHKNGDKTPALFVNTKKNFCYCFVCGLHFKNTYEALGFFIFESYFKYKNLINDKSNLKLKDKLKKYNITYKTYKEIETIIKNNEVLIELESLLNIYEKEGKIKSNLFYSLPNLDKVIQNYHLKFMGFYFDKDNLLDYKNDKFYDIEKYVYVENLLKENKELNKYIDLSKYLKYLENFELERNKIINEILKTFLYFLNQNKFKSDEHIKYLKNRGLSENLIKEKNITSFSFEQKRNLENAMLFSTLKKFFNKYDINRLLIFIPLSEKDIDAILKNPFFRKMNQNIDIDKINIKDIRDKIFQLIKDKIKIEELDNFTKKLISTSIFKELRLLFYDNLIFLNKQNLIIPYYNEKKELIGIKTRIISEKKITINGVTYEIVKTDRGKEKLDKKWRFLEVNKLDVFNIFDLINNKLCFITEGEIDALTLNELGFPAISIPGASKSIPKEYLKYFFGKTIIILGDNDDPGLKFIERIKKEIGNYTENIYTFFIDENKYNVKDINDFIKEYGKEKTKNFIYENIIIPLNLKNDIRKLKYENRKLEKEELEKIELKEDKFPLLNIKIFNSNKDNISKYINLIKDRHFSINSDELKDDEKIFEKSEEVNKYLIFEEIRNINNHKFIILFNDKQTQKEFNLNYPEKNINFNVLKRMIKDYKNNVRFIFSYYFNDILNSDIFSNEEKENILIGINNYDLNFNNLKLYNNNKYILVSSNEFVLKEELEYYIFFNYIEKNTKLDDKEIDKLKKKKEFLMLPISYSDLKNISNKNNIQILKYLVNETNNIIKEFINEKQNKEIKQTNENKRSEEIVDFDIPNNLISEKIKEKYINSSYKEKVKILKEEFKKLVLYMYSEEKFKKQNYEYYPPIIYKIKSKNLIKLINPNDIEKYNKAIKKELDIYSSFGTELYYKYFSFLSEIVNELKKENVFIGIGRGSASASIIAYLLNITEVDPVKYDLLIERFINSERKKDEPDIDIDYSSEDSNKIRKKIKMNYPYINYYTISTENKMGIKQSIMDVLRILGIKKEKIAEITKKIEKEELEDKNIQQIKELLTEENIDLDINYLLDIINGLKGKRRSIGEHPSAHIFSNSRIPLPTVKTDNNIDKLLITKDHFKEGIKYDFLSSVNLTFLKRIFEKAKKYNINLDIDYSNISSINFNDEKVYLFYKNINNIYVFKNIPQYDSENEYFLELKKVLYNLMYTSNSEDNLLENANFISLIRPGALIFENEYLINKIGTEYKIDLKDIKYFNKKFKNKLDTFVKKLNKYKNDKEKYQKFIKNNEIIQFLNKINQKYNLNFDLTNNIDIKTLLKIINIKEETYKVNFLKENIINKNYEKYFVKLFEEDISTKEKLEILKSFKIIKDNINEKEMIELIEDLKIKFYNLKLYQNQIYYNLTFKKYKTYGTLLYQEQIMELLRNIGLNWGEINDIRKGLSKKNVEIIKIYKEKAIELFQSKLKLDKKLSLYLWEKIEESAKYSFNKAHAIAYAMFSFIFMKLKKDYSEIFFQALKEVKEIEPTENEKLIFFDKDLNIKQNNNLKIN